MSDKERSLEAKAKGNELCGEQRWEEAIEQYTQAIELDDSNHIFWANRSACHAQMRNYDMALADATQCIKLNDLWAKGYTRKAQAEFHLGRLAEAEESCRAGLEIDPANVALQSQIQQLRDAGHKIVDGGENVADETALEIDLEAAAAAKAKGNAAFASKNFSAAVGHFTEAIRFNPQDHVFFSNRSASYAGLEQYEDALADAKACVALNGSWAKGYNRQSLAHYELGQYPAAEAAAAKGLTIDPDNAALKELLRKAQLDTVETAEVQAQLYEMRKKQRDQSKLMRTLQSIPGLDMSNVNVNGMGGLGGLGGMGMGGIPGMGGMQSDAQMRQMARAMAQAGQTGTPAQVQVPGMPEEYSPAR